MRERPAAPTSARQLAPDFEPDRVRAALRAPARRRAGLARRPSADLEPAERPTEKAAGTGETSAGRPVEPEAASSAGPAQAAGSPTNPAPAEGSSAEPASAAFVVPSGDSTPAVAEPPVVVAPRPSAKSPAEAAPPPDEPVAKRSTEDEPSVRQPPRPLGQAPMLDSEPLPATRPGMLRPRPPVNGNRPGDTGPPADGYSLPAQRPASEVGSGEPADIA